MSEWLYEDKPIDETILDNYHGFVYLIENTLTGKQYYGKKRLKFIRSKKLKTQKRKIKVVTDSDWKDYYGSSNELLADVELLGKDKFKRTIIRFCKSKGECSYWELWYQMTHHVLMHPTDFYNNYVGARIHRKHVLKKA